MKRLDASLKALLKTVLTFSLAAGLFHGCKKSEYHAPVFISPAVVTVGENQSVAITLESVEKDGDTITYSIGSGDADAFHLNGTTGVVTFKNPPDFETKNRYTFTATARDSLYHTEQTVTINISDYFHPLQIARIVSEDTNGSYVGLNACVHGDYVALTAQKSNSFGTLIYVFKADANGTVA